MYTITSSGYTYAVFLHQTENESIFIMQMESPAKQYNQMVAGSILFPLYSILLGLHQEVWNRMEKGSTWLTLPYDYTCFAKGKSRLNNDKHTHFLGCKNIDNTNVFFIILKIYFYLTSYILRNTFKILKDDLKTLFQLESRMQSMYKSYGRAGRRDLFSILFRFTWCLLYSEAGNWN